MKSTIHPSFILNPANLVFFQILHKLHLGSFPEISNLNHLQWFSYIIQLFPKFLYMLSVSLRFISLQFNPTFIRAFKFPSSLTWYRCRNNSEFEVLWPTHFQISAAINCVLKIKKENFLIFFLSSPLNMSYQIKSFKIQIIPKICLTTKLKLI